MQTNHRPVTQTLLNTDLSDLAHSLVRELAMAFRKVSIYGPAHPLSLKSLEKPFFICSQFFRLRKYVTINVQRGNLYVQSIALKESVFNTQIMQYFQMLEMKAVVFDNTLTSDEFLFFVSTMVKRETLYDAAFSMPILLKQQNISSIGVNTELAYDLFENRKQYRGDVDGDFSARRFALDLMGGSIDQLTRLSGATADALLKARIDFYPEIVAYLMPDRVIATPWSEIRSTLSELVREINTSGPDRTASVDLYMSIFKLIEMHPDRKKIVTDLNVPDGMGQDGSPESDDASRTGQIKIESNRRMEALTEQVFSQEPTAGLSPVVLMADYKEAYLRLLRTGQIPKAQSVVGDLIDRLSSPDAPSRQKSLDLLTAIISELNLLSGEPVLETAVAALERAFTARRESFEYTELVWCLAQKCLAGKRYPLLERLTGALAQRKTVSDGVTIYDSMAIKKAFENINRPEVISRLVDDLLRAQADEPAQIKTILVNIGSEEIALALSQIISHPNRQVRQMSLKILAELGKNSLKVFSDLLVDDAWFEREKGRHELPDAKWYVVRNAIFVLGSLRDQGGITALRLRINDSDIRVRREIISSIEKIGGDEAVDLLVVMAEDRDKEIREAALITLGVIGTPDSVPMVIDVTKRNPSDAVRAITSIGKIGGVEAKAFLGYLLENDEALTRLAAGMVSREDLKAAIVRALGSIGDNEAISKVRAYSESLNAAQKLLMRGSAVQKAIAEVLARK